MNATEPGKFEGAGFLNHNIASRSRQGRAHHETNPGVCPGEGVRQSMISKPKRRSLTVITASALCVLAFTAVPAMASAAQLLNPTKTPVANGTRLVLRSTNVILAFSPGGTESCKSWEFIGLVKENSGSVVQVEGGTGEEKAQECSISGAPTLWNTSLGSMELTPTNKQLAFSMTDGSFTESSLSAVSYISGATSIHVAGALKGSLVGTFTGDFKILNPKGAEVSIVG